jgi:ADP-ribose pyrophosphatase
MGGHRAAWVAAAKFMIKPWPELGSRELGDFRVFKVRAVRKMSPRTGREHEFFVIDCPNWVNVIATTPNQEIVLIEQFRHGSKTVELEVPGGMLDPEDASPMEGGARELREETGYTGDGAVLIGSNYPNPAIMSNTCFTALVENCRPTADLELDQAEDVVTRLAPIAEIPGLVASGKIRHALVIVALYHYELWRGKRGNGGN